MILGASPNYRDTGQFERLRHLRQECGPTQQGLQERDSEVWAGDGQDDSRQPGTGADVAHCGVGRDDAREHPAVQQMPVPQPRHLARAEETSLSTRARQQFGVPPS